MKTALMSAGRYPRAGAGILTDFKMMRAHGLFTMGPGTVLAARESTGVTDTSVITSAFPGARYSNDCTGFSGTFGEVTGNEKENIRIQ